MPIYVAGPVLRTGTRQPRWVAECYRLIQDVARPSPRYQVLLPAAELLLESMDARGFTTELRRRIVGADKVIAVFLPDDQSTPIECALAAAAGKRVLLLHEAGARVPRILAGLPGVTTAPYDQGTHAAITLFLLD